MPMKISNSMLGGLKCQCPVHWPNTLSRLFRQRLQIVTQTVSLEGILNLVTVSYKCYIVPFTNTLSSILAFL